MGWACEQHGTPLFCIKVVTDLVDGGGVGEVSEVRSPHETPVFLPLAEFLFPTALRLTYSRGSSIRRVKLPHTQSG